MKTFDELSVGDFFRFSKNGILFIKIAKDLACVNGSPEEWTHPDPQGEVIPTGAWTSISCW